MDTFKAKTKKAVVLWLKGFKEACCLHRVVVFCLRSKRLSIRTGQCFLLNGFLFLGSIFVLNSLVIPTLQWILPYQCQQFGPEDPCSIGLTSKVYSILRFGLVQIFYMLWFYPLYVLSFVLSNIWYSDIAKHAYVAMGDGSADDLLNRKDLSKSQDSADLDKPAGLGGAILGVGEHIYSNLLLGVFFLQILAAGFIPHMGKALAFVFHSWMYAYYSFEYKWNLDELGLDKRLDFFESHWAFFAGFGSPCILACYIFPPLVSYGVMAVLFPLFVLTATGSKAERILDSQRRTWSDEGLGRLPIFCLADTILMKVLSYFGEKLQVKQEDKKEI
ncbi:Ei24-like protein [Thalictrum thalictroides]|uniref:Ei24-like protein n=1 Tax=Thalictrum thalictroides TaxID=46969 RepID=A0A7J6WX16_THATH|nr:Ei24-like protein [Thalictrum thalictroides]